MEVILLDGHYSAVKPAAGNDLVAGFQFLQHLLPLFLTPLLRHDQQKIKDGKHQRHHAQERQTGPGALRLHCQQVLQVHEDLEISFCS